MYITHAQVALAWGRVGECRIEGTQSADAHANEVHAFLIWQKLLSRSSVQTQS